MRTELSREQVEQYQRDGFTIIENFLTADELERWRRAVGAAVKARGDRMLPKSLGDHLDDARAERNAADYYSQVFIQRVNLWLESADVADLILDAAIGKIACELEGIDGVRIWHDQALIKQPWGNPTSWHLDNPYWSFTSRHAISLWLALDDATLENGCLWFMPGSHKEASSENVGIGPNMGHLFDVYPQWRTRKAVPAPMKAGSCSFHNGLTAHAANANMTPGYRRAMTCGFMPVGSVFNGIQNILPAEKFQTLKTGDPLEFDDLNPIVYARS